MDRGQRVESNYLKGKYEYEEVADKLIEANETVVSPEPVSITDDPTCETNTVAVNSPIPSKTTWKILGTLWNSNEDALTIDFDEMLCLTELSEIPYLTKRILLSSISKIFDPMGLASPAVVMMKVMSEEYGAKFPIILPGSHDVTKLIVRKCYETVGHNGVKDTLTQL